MCPDFARWSVEITDAYLDDFGKAFGASWW
jgi:hypothetical protein